MKNPATMSFAAPVRFAALAAVMSFAALAPSSASAVTATKDYVDKRDAAIAAAATNHADSAAAAAQSAALSAVEAKGYVTASVTNGLASAASVAQEAKDRADAIAAEKAAREKAGYLTAEKDPSTGLTNGTAYVRGKRVISEHQSLDAYLKTADLASKETDPTVPSWAKAETKPSYSASEVGTYTTSEIDSKIDAASPSDYATVKANAASALSTANANKTSIASINSAGYITQTTADSSYYPKASGDAWSTYWDGDDVRVTVTNYDSVAHLPSLYLEQRTNNTASASSDTNAFRVVWRELAHWDAFLGSTWNWEDTAWQGFDAWRSSLSSQLDEKADRAWGFYDSHTGAYAPDGYTSISSSNVMICAGASYQKTATATCDIWVLTANEPYEPTGVSTNGGFQIKDADGNVQFEIVKGNKSTVKAQANGVSVDSSTTPNTLVVTYNIVAEKAPTGEVCLELANAQWKSETDSDCPATVEWSGSSGAWVARITPTASTDRCFFKASYETGGNTYVNNRCAVGMSQLVLNGTTYNLGTATIDGHTVLTLTPAQ